MASRKIETAFAFLIKFILVQSSSLMSGDRIARALVSNDRKTVGEEGAHESYSDGFASGAIWISPEIQIAKRSNRIVIAAAIEL